MVQKNETVSMTEGGIFKQLFQFFLPIFWGGFFQQIYQMTDALVVGRFAGKVAFGALDATGNFIRLPLVFFLGMATGASIIVAQSFGGKNYKCLRDSLHTTMGFTLVAGCVLSLIFYLLAPTMVNWMHVPEEMAVHALAYTRALFIGLIFSFIYNMGYGILRALGDSKRPFYYLLISLGLNVVLDIFFIAVLHMASLGAGIATVISQAVTALLVLRAMSRLDEEYGLSFRKICIHKTNLLEILTMGIPISIQSMAYPIINIFTQSRINSFGTNAIVAWGINGKVDFIVWMMVEAIAVSVATFTAQNYGAGNLDRIKKGVHTGFIMAACTLVPLSILLYFFGGEIGRIFIDDVAVVALNYRIFRYFMAPFYVFQGVGDIIAGAIRGTGKTIRPMTINLICICGFRFLWVLLIVPMKPTLDMTLTNYSVSWILMCMAFLWTYKRGKWLEKEV